MICGYYVATNPTKLPRVDLKTLSYMSHDREMSMSSDLIYNIYRYRLIDIDLFLK